MVIKIEGRVDGFFLSEFFKIIFHIRFHEIKIDRDMPFVFYIIGQQKQIPVALKLENTLGFFFYFRMTHPLKRSFKQCSGTEIWYTKSPNNNLNNEGSKFCIWIQPTPLPGAAILWSHQTQSTSNASNSAKNWNLEKVPEFESHITSG